jgi:hypothetical protein
MKTTLWFLLAFCFLTFNKTVLFAAENQTASKFQQSLLGKIENITATEITLAPDDGKMRKFSIIPAQRVKIKLRDLKQGDRVSLMFNQKNQITDIEKFNRSPGPGLTPAPVPTP